MAAFPSLRTAIMAGLLLGIPGTGGMVAYATPVAGSAPIPAPIPKARRHEYRHEIERLEEAWREAMLKSSSDALAPLLAEDYTGITAQGAIQTKDQVLTSLRSGTFQLTAISVADRKIRVYGTTAVVTSMAELVGKRNDEELNGRYRYTRVYVRNGSGQWKIVSFEASRIQEAGERKQ